MSGEASIRRGVRNARYSAIPNHVFEDTRLSMDARWLLGYLLSKPDHWKVVIGDIVNKGNCGRDKARKMISELVDAGYAEREQTREDGRFSAASFVIYDEPRTAAEGAETESVAFLPQTEMPSPVKPSPVSPSPVKSAHSNNSNLENTDFEQEGDARESVSGEDAKASYRAFKRWYGDWPTRKSDSTHAAEKAWQALTPEQRAECIAKSPLYIERANATKGVRVPYAGVYLNGRDWEKLDDPKSDVALPTMHKPFSRPWHALRLFELTQPIATTVPAPTAMQQRMMDAGGDVARQIVLERKQKYGWPKVNTMHERASDHKGMTVTPALLRISEGFGKAHVGGDVAAAWQRLHERKGWPWLPHAPGLEWLWLPHVDEGADDLDGAVADAMAEFERTVIEGRNDDAA